MAALLDLILFLVAVRAVWRLVGGMMAGMKVGPAAGQQGSRGSPGSQPPPSAVQMARDPVCGTFVVPDRAPSLSIGHERVYFCSDACRDKYRAKTA